MSGYTAIGKIRGADGAQGNSQLSGSGAPANLMGTVGDSFVDTTNAVQYDDKTSSTWGSGTSLVGPAGATGPSAGTQPAQGAFNLLDGLPVGYNASTSVSSSPTVMPYPGGYFTSKYWPKTAGALYAVSITVGGSPGSVTFSLAEMQNSPTVVYWTSPAITAAGTYYYPIGSSAAPITLVAGQTAQADWRVAGSGSITCIVQPIYMATSAAAIGYKTMDIAGLPAGATLTSSPLTLPIMGATSTMRIAPVTTGYFYSATLVNQSATGCVFTLMNASTNLAVYTSPSVSGTYEVPVMTATAVPLLAGNSYYWAVTGSAISSFVSVETRMVA